jgi:hypothetical protein
MSVAELARALLVEAARVLPGLDGEAGSAALAEIDAFVAVPLPSRWLRATRTLREMGRRARGERNIAALARRSFDRGLARVGTVSVVGDAAREALSALPVDASSGRRLEALAALLEAHQEVAGRVREADATRRTLKAEIATAPSKPMERRRRR